MVLDIISSLPAPRLLYWNLSTNHLSSPPIHIFLPFRGPSFFPLPAGFVDSYLRFCFTSPTLLFNSRAPASQLYSPLWPNSKAATAVDCISIAAEARTGGPDILQPLAFVWLLTVFKHFGFLLCKETLEKRMPRWFLPNSFLKSRHSRWRRQQQKKKNKLMKSDERNWGKHVWRSWNSWKCKNKQKRTSLKKNASLKLN